APLGIIALSTEADVDEVYATARAAQPAWAARPLRERTDIVLRYHDLVMAHRSELMDLIQLESGKARRHAFEEVGDVAIGARHYARNAARYLKPRSRLGGFPLISRPVESYLPKGVVGIVSPWNYPLSLAIGDAIPALIAGNSVVLRPDMQGPLTALAAVELFIEAGMPREVLQVVLGP